jgi:hypothetical protein
MLCLKSLKLNEKTYNHQPSLKDTICNRDSIYLRKVFKYKYLSVHDINAKNRLISVSLNHSDRIII